MSLPHPRIPCVAIVVCTKSCSSFTVEAALYINRKLTLRGAANTFFRIGLFRAVLLGLKVLVLSGRRVWAKRYFTSIGSNVHLGRGVDVRGDVRVGSNSIIEPGVVLWGTGQIDIGDDVYIGHHTFVAAQQRITIASHTAIAAFCYVTDSDHGTNLGQIIKDQAWVSDPVHIGEGAWLGAHTVVLRGSTIGEAAVIGAHSLVKGSIPAYSIAVGVPARVIRNRASSSNA